MKRDGIGKLDNKNLTGVFWRAALAIVYLYLNFAAYQLIGIEGVIITSGFFLVAQFAPLIVSTFVRLRQSRLEKRPSIFAEAGSENRKPCVIPLHSVSQAEQEGL